MVKNKGIGKYNFQFRVNSLNQTIIIIGALLVLGSLIGSIIANNISYTSYNYFKDVIDKFLYGFSANGLTKQYILRESIFKYGFFVILMWGVAFYKKFFIFSFFLIMLRGISLSFTISFFIIEFGIKGLFYSFVIYLPQNFLLILIYFFVIYNSILFSLNNIKNGRSKIRNFNSAEVVEYFVVLIVAMSLIFLVSFYEAYVAPNIIEYLIAN